MNIKEKMSKVAEQAKKASVAVGDRLSEAGKIAKDSARTIAIEILDQDGDGQISQDDVRILTQKAADVGTKAASRAKEVISDACDTDLVRDAAAGAVVGAAIAVPVPLIGPVAGAAIGASVSVYANITKGKADSGNQRKRPKKNNIVKKVAQKVVKPV